MVSCPFVISHLFLFFLALLCLLSPHSRLLSFTREEEREREHTKEEKDRKYKEIEEWACIRGKEIAYKGDYFGDYILQRSKREHDCEMRKYNGLMREDE